MTTITIEDAQAKLPELIESQAGGEELVITEGGQPIATLTRTQPKNWPSRAGSAKTEEYWMAPDFDAPLEELREYNGHLVLPGRPATQRQGESLDRRSRQPQVGQHRD